jgi:ABC-type transport system involved in multi-copper enzyme maturation permease subunit
MRLPPGTRSALAVVALAASVVRVLEPDAVPGWAETAAWALLVLSLLADGAAVGRVRRILGVEMLKLRRGRLFLGGLVLVALTALGAGLAHDPLPHETGWSLASRTAGTAFFVAEVFALVLGAIAVAGESTAGTLKMILPHAYARGDWIAAKGLSVVAAAAAFGLVAAATAGIHAAAAHGLGDVTKETEALFGEDDGALEVFQSAAVMRTHLVQAFAASVASLATTALLGLLFSVLFDGVVASLCAAFLAYGVLEFAEILLGLSREALERLYTWHPDRLLEVTERLGRGLNERWDDALFGLGLRLDLIVAVASLLVATWVFSRRDLQS